MISVSAEQARRIWELESEGKTPDEAMRIVLETPVPTPKAAATVEPKPKRNKYGNVKTEIDGITFDSKREAARYEELKKRADRGEIKDLTLQPRFSLHALRSRSNTYVEIGSYVADFRYTDLTSGKVVFEDAKGMRTALYRWKKKHVEAEYGIEIIEV